MGLGVVVAVIFQVVKFALIWVLLAGKGSTGYDISPSPADLFGSPPVQGSSSLLAPLAPPPLTSGPLPLIKGLVPSLSPTTPVSSNSSVSVPVPILPPQIAPAVHVSPSGTVTPTSDRSNASNSEAPVEEPITADAPPPTPTILPSIPVMLTPTPSVNERNGSNNRVPTLEPTPPAALPPSSTINPSIPATPPSSSHERNKSDYHAPIPSAPQTNGTKPPTSHQGNSSDDKSPTISPATADPDVSPSPTSASEKGDVPSSAPANNKDKPLPPVYHPPTKAPSKHSNDSPSPLLVPTRSPAYSPSRPFIRPHHARKKINGPASSHLISLPPKHQGPANSPVFLPSRGARHLAPPPFHPGSSLAPSLHPVAPSITNVSSVPSPSRSTATGWNGMPILSPKSSMSESSSPHSPKNPLLPPIQSFPPPPPNEDCSSIVCTEPYTNTPPGSPCGCVWPMQVGLRLSVSLYTFFPLVSELAGEIATGVFMKQSQVRIIGANSDIQASEKAIVLIDLVPLGQKFDNTTAFLTYDRFWHKKVVINPSIFGEYEVLYVRYLGLPPSPPSAPIISMIDDGPYSGNGNNAGSIKPIGVNLPKRGGKDRLKGGVVAVIVLSALVAVVLCGTILWVLLFKVRDRASQSVLPPQALSVTVLKSSGATVSLVGSAISSASLSFASSIAPFAGSAKTFSTDDIKTATDNFNTSRVLGEGGFGLVYSGVLEDGTRVAVKVLKRDDQQSGREFLAEVEMLSRLHHRNLVKLIGICIEERSRCLVYELIPNGSVESHLHGADKETLPLDWDARVKIALGSARGLAYLHEDSSPRVIHRDFKSSNILLEHDFTPKVSDFGLARSATDEDNGHISTRVMGTFGYVAPEYAMTGHLLVKSDVYSYGVVLLELLTGRKPIDMSQPSGQENLVSWARHLLTTREGLESIIDQFLGPDTPFDSIAKVAAIASMCVQPEVTHRPFMGEVVQALKLVSNECDEAKEVGSTSSSRANLSIDLDGAVSVQSQNQMTNYEAGLDMEMGQSIPVSGSLRRSSSLGPLRTGRGRELWQRIRVLTGGSASEHGVMFTLRPGSN